MDGEIPLAHSGWRMKLLQRGIDAKFPTATLEIKFGYAWKPG